MKITTAPPKPADKWRRRFAFLPTRVGVTDDGRIVWIWLRPYASRHHGQERRPLSDTKGVSPVYIQYE